MLEKLVSTPRRRAARAGLRTRGKSDTDNEGGREALRVGVCFSASAGVWASAHVCEEMKLHREPMCCKYRR